MAIKVNFLKEKLLTDPFTDKELEIIDLIESWIDFKLSEEYDGDYVLIDDGICEFKYYPDTNYDNIDIKNIRRNLMQAELKKRYELAGWNVTKYSTDDDGPNRSGFDYWKFEEKKGY